MKEEIKSRSIREREGVAKDNSVITVERCENNSIVDPIQKSTR
jgi:hypothetical protein